MFFLKMLEDAVDDKVSSGCMLEIFTKVVCHPSNRYVLQNLYLFIYIFI